ncbi:PAT family beta-lactamase induction signal transducer AmpG [Natronospira proteinivora]|uniref:PAT family beta-lactamase induction signal transducer AmpG n=1 Tax=Natronospira proteinivora TaxID=1807133 RepID=A0ABT1G9D8_9GAMM|nr:MFS transporter [Natronospira proteinivora]MCP1727861.1 PAT family beta-lactamase induction signal transducer AmpG [Natronospira proteinivora]
MSDADTGARPAPNLFQALKVYLHARVVGMAFLGFAAGLPFMLVGATFTNWLADLGVERAAIGFLSWASMAYSIKFLWAPVVDRLELPILGRLLGRRRSWMLSAQVLIALGLLGMALINPADNLMIVAGLAVITAFGSATQDIAIDAYRVEAVGRERQSAMAATYVAGYRVAMVTALTGALNIVAFANWTLAYGAMALLMTVGMITTLIIREPEARMDRMTAALEQRVIDYLDRTDHNGIRRDLTAWFIGAVICPFADFMKRFGGLAILILLFIATFRVSDIFMGVMAQPFYLDVGFTQTQIGNITGAFGLAMTLAGAFMAGILVARFGVTRMLIFGALMAPATNLIFAWVAIIGPETYGLILAIIGDNITGGLAVGVFIAYLSSLTNSAYTATQYALFSSIMTLPGQFAAGFTGMLADAVDWVWFFIITAGTGIPAIALALVLAWYANPDRINRPGMEG